MNTRRHFLQSLATPVLFGSMSHVHAATAYPRGPVTVLVPFPPGGPTDVLTRIMTRRLGQAWGQSVIVDYKPGAATMLGAQAVARAPADGYSIGVVNSAFTINPVIQKRLIYNPSDLTGVTQMAEVPIAIAASAKAPFDTLQQLVTYAKANPGKVTFATPGVGGTSHLAGELLNQVAGIQMTHVPYQGSSPAHTDVIGGRVDLMIDPMLSLMPLVLDGRLKLIAGTSAQRVKGYTQYPVVAETYPGFDLTAIIGLVVPARTPPDIIATIQRDANAAMQHPEDRKMIDDLGVKVVSSTPQEWNARLASETSKFGKLIKDAGIALAD